MSARWVAGNVRARALSSRRVGTDGARALAAAPSLDDAVRQLAATPYGRDVHAGQTLAQAQHAVGATLLWHLRVLAGWQPREGVESVRLLAGGFEITNSDELLLRLRGGSAEEPYQLGRLGVAWRRLVSAASRAEVREILAASAWGDPGADTPAAIELWMRMSWAARVSTAIPEAVRWAAGAAALRVAREVFQLGRRLDDPAGRRVAALLGPGALTAGTVADFRRVLGPDARWALSDVDAVDDLWRAEARWWHRLEADGFELLHGNRFDGQPVVGTVAVLAADAWRVRAALRVAAGGGAVGVFDVLV
ncbi:MAG TPA: hypothetical protein VFV67_01585 [Actinophytocola sp.]|uniref:hypothetical protein n=1 Tax=Actinophytocola sp. TaxID=1872138 RepID=UPI002DBD8C6D|nr:hypothetical protein [Actinophytocola sp.]HEU5469316.1 hypothetical protein [Actinophytocola sp.]